MRRSTSDRRFRWNCAVGNQANRVDILNAALGLSAEVRAWVITNGFVAPIRSAPDRGFDFEYNLQAQRLF